MAKDKGGAEEEQDKLGRHLLQILAQEDTLKALEQKDFASQETLTAILAQLDITLSALRDALRGTGTKDFTTLETDIESILARLNVNLSTRATEATLAAQLDITQSTLRDALRGASTKDFSTLETDVESVYTKLNTQLNITLSTLRDAITDATNPKDLKDLYDELILIKGQLDSKTSTLAKETGGNLAALAAKDFATQTTLALIKAKTDNLNLALTTLRNDLRGASTKDFTTLETDVESVYTKLNAQLDITISALRDALKGASNKDFSTLEADLETVAGDTPALNDDSIKGLMRTMGDAGATPTNVTGKTLLKLLDEILTQTSDHAFGMMGYDYVGATQAQLAVDPTTKALLVNLKCSAADIDIVDAGGHYVSSEVESALQELGLATTISAAQWGYVGALTANPIGGDATAGRKLRGGYISILDGTDANTLKCALVSLWNGDTIAETDNIAKNATTGNFSLGATGERLTIEASGLTGNAVYVLGLLYYNASGTAYLADVTPVSNDIVIYLRNATAATTTDLTAIVDAGVIYMFLFYITDA